MNSPTPHALSLREVVIAPFRALKSSGVTLIVFEAVVFLAAASAAALLPPSFASLSATWLPQGSKFLAPLVIAEKGLGVLALLIVLIVTVALPTRIIWLYHTLKITRLLVEFPPALARCTRAALLLWRDVFFVTLAASASLIISQQIAQAPPKGQLALYVVVSGLALIACYHGVRFVLALLTSIVVRLEVETQYLHINRIVQRALGRTVVILIIAAILPTGLFFAPDFPQRNALEWPLNALVAWYALTAMGVICLEAGEAYARMDGRTFRVQPDQEY